MSTLTDSAVTYEGSTSGSDSDTNDTKSLPINRKSTLRNESETRGNDFHCGNIDNILTLTEARSQAKANWMANGYDGFVVAWLVIIHVGCLAAPFFFSWTGLVVALALHWLTGGIGVCLGYHRLLTHDSFKAPRWVRYTLAAIGGLSGEGSALHWVANHRKHHAHSDDLGDPHSPGDGAWWSHITWTMAKRTPEDIEQLHSRWIPDIKNDRGLQRLHELFLPIHVSLALILAGAGYAIGGWFMAASLVIWGMFVRLALVLHSTWFVNSASHMWGYRNYDTTDDSRNNWWVAIITYGEGWHNNHHAYPRMARHGHKWWEIDMTYMAIRVLQFLGLAGDVVDHQHKKTNDLSTVKNPAAAAMDTAAILKAHQPHLEKTRVAQQQSDNLHHVE